MNPWLTEIQAVAHDAGCGSGATIDMEYGFPHLTRDPCSCSRDARIAAGVAAVQRFTYAFAPGDRYSKEQDESDVLERSLAAFRAAAKEGT
jgi:hypothetical protein